MARLVPTHFASVEPEWPRGLAKAASREFAGPVTLAEPGLAIPVRRPFSRSHRAYCRTRHREVLIIVR
ncbi:hypothetical protein ACQPZF_21900 [Actinosynnema sp. CS-041913]|uniref:hypothetical protein n=1 Tax=Actinosynnema sp. CS-041913 TaxID=3239917 RepID=UPI003D90BAF9